MRPGTTLLHYEIREKLGEGGMGEVYRALDSRLNRDVAIKILAPKLAHDPVSLERFRREAQAVAAVDHPNIVTIHAVERDGATHFFTMELVRGRPLHRVIPRGGLDPRRLFDLALPVAEGLAAAHERGILHRDLKPANVMLGDDGRIRILDFGLAKLDRDVTIGDQDRTRTAVITQDGAILGTVPYMSPEQIEGKALDRRSDVFSLGVVLYEMATGVRPFHGDTQPALISSILRDAPAPIVDLRVDLPQRLAGIVQRCLEKSPDDRYGSATAVAEDLRAARTDAASPTVPVDGSRDVTAHAAVASPSPEPVRAERSIAVLPFVNRSSDPDDQYFSDGLSEELINALSKIRGLKVTARSSAFQFRGQELDVRDVGRQLAVETVLEGSVRMAGNRLRITTELVNCADGYQLWSRRFDGEMTDIFDTQDEIARAIVGQLEVELGSAGDGRLVKRGTDSLEAYNWMLKARYHMGDFFEPGLVRAIECLEHAVELDPEYAQAYADLSFCWLIRSVFGTLSGPEGFPRVRETARRALELDPDLGDAHAAFALYSWYDFDWDTAERELHRALDLNPQSVWTHFYTAGHYSITRRHRDIVPHVEKMRELDPLHRPVCAHVALFLFYAGRVDDAIAAARTSLDMYPDYWLLHYDMSFFHWKKRDGDAAIAAMRRAIELTGDTIPFLSCLLAAMLFFFGRDDEGDRHLAHVEKLETTLPRSEFGWLVIEAVRGDTDAAIAHLERGRAEHDTLICWSRAFCEQQGILADERLREAMARVGLP